MGKESWRCSRVPFPTKTPLESVGSHPPVPHRSSLSVCMCVCLKYRVRRDLSEIPADLVCTGLRRSRSMADDFANCSIIFRFPPPRQ